MSAVTMLIAVFCMMGLSTDHAAAQARGVIIQIPDDVAPGSSRSAPPPPVQTPPAASPGVPGSPAGSQSACQGASCTAGKNLWHVLNTSNRTCLALSKDDLKGGKDVRKLSTLLPAPLFVVASGACP